MTPIEIQAARPRMLSRQTAANVLAHHAGQATPPRRAERSHRAGWIVALALAAAYVVWG